MKKIFIGIGVLVVIIILVVYGLLFTQLGNNIIKPTLQEKISKAIGKNVIVTRFSLRPSTVILECALANKRFLAVKGALSLFSQKMDLDYTLDIPDISEFVNEKNLRGGITAKGKIAGDFKNFAVSGNASVFGGVASYKVILTNRKPTTIILSLSQLRLAKLLAMMKKPKFVDGVLSIKANLKNLGSGKSSGNAVITVEKGMTNADLLKKKFNFERAKIPFTANFHIVANGKMLNANGNIKSSVAFFKLKKSYIDLNSFSANGVYTLNIPDLNRLYFATKRHMRGKIFISGYFKKDKDVVVNAISKNLAGGVLSINLKNDVVKVRYKDGRVTKLMDMLMYPKVFDSVANLNLTYNIKTTKGTSHIVLINGHFLPNRMSFLINTLAGFDITREIYKKSTIDSKIDNKTIVSDLYMKSRLTEITSKNAYINLNTNKIDMVLLVKIGSKPLKVFVKGSLNKPSVKLDIKGFLIKGGVKKKLKGLIKVPKSIEKLF